MIDAACKTPQEPIPPIAGDGSIHEPKELIDKKVKVPVMREIASDFNTIFFFMKFTIFFTLKICRYEGFLKKIKDLGEDFKDWTELKLLFMESEKVLNRKIEFLPYEDAIIERNAQNQGLYGPELSILLSYSKLTYKDALLASNLADEAFFDETLLEYFPLKMQKTYEKENSIIVSSRNFSLEWTWSSWYNR